jgi:hypothetical protein
MHVRRNSVLLCALAALAIAVPASADHGDIHPTTRTERTYFTCAGETKAQTVHILQDNIPSWDTTAPTDSVSSGAGCGHLEGPVAGAQPGTIHDAIWQGTFTGNLSSLTVELHSINATFDRALAEQWLQVTLLVDGEVIYEPANEEDYLVVSVEPSESGASHAIRFSITHLPFLLEDGDGEQEREITLAIHNEDFANLWVWDTTEVPAGITFNPVKPEPVRIRP